MRSNHARRAGSSLSLGVLGTAGLVFTRPSGRLPSLSHLSSWLQSTPADSALLTVTWLVGWAVVAWLTTIAFLADLRHHLLVAVDDGQTVGFISGVEMTHPDKGTEMFLYELAVAEDARQRGIGLALTARLVELARTQGCYGMC